MIFATPAPRGTVADQRAVSGRAGSPVTAARGAQRSMSSSGASAVSAAAVPGAKLKDLDALAEHTHIKSFDADEVIFKRDDEDIAYDTN